MLRFSHAEGACPAGPHSQPDRRRRGRGASGLRRQRACGELDRRRRLADRDSRGRRLPRHPGGRQRLRHGGRGRRSRLPPSRHLQAGFRRRPLEAAHDGLPGGGAAKHRLRGQGHLLHEDFQRRLRHQGGGGGRNRLRLRDRLRPGTVIEVNDLFYNVPARLKFLKKPSTEFAHVHEVVQALAVAYPKIVFQLLNSGQVVFKTSGSGKLAQAMVESGFASGKEDMCRVTYADLDHGIAVYGYVARPTHFRGDRKAIMSIVNNRPVRCHLTYKALDYAYQDLIPRGRYPIAVLTMTLDPGRVDVNVHPTKKEIKYTNGNDVYLTLQRSVLEAVRRPEEERSEEPVQMPRWLKTTGDYPIIPEPAIGRAGEGTGRVGEGAPAGVGALPAAGQRSSAQQIKLDEQLSYVPPQAVARPPGAASVVPLRPRLAGLPANWRLLGYLNNTYILLETPEGLEIVEQHIAHERTIYERFWLPSPCQDAFPKARSGWLSPCRST